MPIVAKSRTASASSAARTGRGRALQKGQQTKAAIVDAALGLATPIGVEGLSIGALAEVTHMSKSGVFAHFGSREELQISVIREYHVRFEDAVFYPALNRNHDRRAELQADLSVSITRQLALTAAAELRYNSDPGTNVYKMDRRFITGVSWKLLD